MKTGLFLIAILLIIIISCSKSTDTTPSTNTTATSFIVGIWVNSSGSTDTFNVNKTYRSGFGNGSGSYGTYSLNSNEDSLTENYTTYGPGFNGAGIIVYALSNKTSTSFTIKSQYPSHTYTLTKK